MSGIKVNDRANKTAGFTLVEILIALAISGIIATAVLTMFKSQSESYLQDEQRVEAMQNVRAGMEMISRDIRNAGYIMGQWIDPFKVGIVDVYEDGSFMLKTDNVDEEGEPISEENDAIVIRTVEAGPRITKGPSLANIVVCKETPFENYFPEYKKNATGVKRELYFMVDASGTDYATYRLAESIRDKACHADCPVGECFRLSMDKDKPKVEFTKDATENHGNNKFDGGRIYRLAYDVYYINPDLDGNDSTEDPALMHIEDPHTYDPANPSTKPLPQVVAYNVNVLEIGYAPEGAPSCDPSAPQPAQTDIMNMRTVCPHIQALTRDPFQVAKGVEANYTRNLDSVIKVRNMGLTP